MSIPERRLSNQWISGKKAETPKQAVAHLGALQAQDYHQAVWAIGARTHKATLTGIEQCIENREILQTWPMRGTIHFVPAEDAEWMLKLLAPRIMAKDKRRLEQLELAPETVERAKEIFRITLQGKGKLTRAALMTALEESGIGAKGQRGYHLLWHAAQSGIIAMGPREGKEQTFVLLEEWLRTRHEYAGEEALAMLAVRYFTGHGPANAADFAWWSGLTLTEARRGIAAAGALLSSEQAGGQTYFFSASEAYEPLNHRPSVFLLPGFDEYLIGYKDRNDVLKKEHAEAIVPGSNGVFKPMIVIDGQISGVWKRTLKKKSVDIELRMFKPLADRESELLEAAAEYCDFVELAPGELEIKGPDKQ